MAIAAKADQIRFVGHSSYYGGPCDGEDNNQTASGVPNTVPGFATLFVPFGKWFLVQDGKRRALGVSLERGPASWTGRIVDLNYTLVGRLGYGPGPCYGNYPNGYVSLSQIVVGLRYPSCGWAGRLAGRELRHRIGKLGQPGNCLYQEAAARLRRFQRAHHHPRSARRGVVDLGTWRALLRAR